ncbi:MAG: hypothetical protein LC689_00280, partial [Myxococcales bacterium]|nr:hypothetical protein [Myxococcales bacterium]
GGSGGAVWLQAPKIFVDTGAIVSAAGGSGGFGGTNNGQGGSGGLGRIRLSLDPTATVGTVLLGSFNPVPKGVTSTGTVFSTGTITAGNAYIGYYPQ